jgi:hypothetical protein
VIGGTRVGKSKFLEYLIRDDIDNWRPFALLDWHGTLYRDVLAHLGSFWSERPIVLVNLREPRYVKPLDFFSCVDGDEWVTASRRVGSLIRPFGEMNTNEMPTFERIARMLFTFAVQTGETLPNAALLLQFPKKELRDYAVSVISDPFIKQQWKELQYVKTLKDWHGHVLSTNNRLGRFLGSQAVKRFIGIKENALDISELMEQGAILLVNLGHSGHLDRQAAGVFASLFLNEFFEAAMRRAERRSSADEMYSLYLDEFQMYVNDEMASMLDQVLKGGLHLVMAHQHMGQALDPWLKESIITNARMRVVFGGLSVPTAKELAEEMLLHEINARQIKETYYRTAVLDYELVELESRSEQVSDTRLIEKAAPPFSWFGMKDEKDYSKTTSRTNGVHQTFRPVLGDEKTNDAEWSRDEKLSQAAYRLIAQPPRHCVVKIDTEQAADFVVPLIEDSGQEPEDIAHYEEHLHQTQQALPAAEADRLLVESEKRFVHRAKHHDDDDEPSTGKRARRS